VFMNPQSTIIYTQLVHGTAIRSTYKVGARKYIYTKTPTGLWLGRGWMDAVEISKNVPSTRVNPTFTLARYIWTKTKNANQGRDEQQEPDVGFSKFLLPGVLFNAYNTEQHFKCPGGNEWFMGKQEQFGQPLAITYDGNGRDRESVQSLLKTSLRTPVVEELEFLRDQCGDGGKTSHRMLKSMKMPSSPPVMIISVVRNAMFMVPGMTIEKLPIKPSTRLSMFGKEYQLVSMAIKTGTSSGGHWVACVHTTTGWYRISDMDPITSIRDITKITNGVQFIYEEIGVPLFEIDKQGLVNTSVRCWANTFTQMIRYAPTFGSLIGITGRLPSFNELLVSSTRNREMYVYISIYK
jgi:hypothetical protein